MPWPVWQRQGNGGFYKLVADTKRIIRHEFCTVQGVIRPLNVHADQLAIPREHREVLPFAARKVRSLPGDKIMDLAGGICQHYVHAMLS